MIFRLSAFFLVLMGLSYTYKEFIDKSMGASLFKYSAILFLISLAVIAASFLFSNKIGSNQNSSSSNNNQDNSH